MIIKENEMEKVCVAVLADLHLPDDPGTVKEEILDWAVKELKKRKIKEILAAGDMTAVGTLAAAKRVKAKLSSIKKGGFFCTLGNAELRSPEEAEATCRELATPAISPHFLLLDSSGGRFTPSARTILTRQLLKGGRKSFAVLTHYPPSSLPEEDQLLLALGGKLGVIELIVHGHLHDESYSLWKKIPTFEVRAMDPDKSIGGPPCIALFTRNEKGKWSRKDLVYDKADPRTWSGKEKQELLANLGISGMNIPLESLAFAAENKVPVFEWRYTALSEEERKTFLSALSRWRKEGEGKCFSIHFPDCRFQEGKWTGLEALEDAVKLAFTFSADRITLHVPRTTVSHFSDPAALEEITEKAAHILKPLAEKGIVIGVENLHMRPGEKADEERGYGYTPMEVLEYVALLQKKGVDCGVHLDLGHVRNNAPFASFYTVTDWLALCGPLINGCHLHQVIRDEEGVFHNHKALTQLFGKFISLGSLFLAWKNMEIPHPPLILEIRHEMGPLSLEKLREALGENKRYM